MPAANGPSATFARIDGAEDCCASPQRAKLFVSGKWTYYNASACAVMCEQHAGCSSFSHGLRYGRCYLCTAANATKRAVDPYDKKRKCMPYERLGPLPAASSHPFCKGTLLKHCFKASSLGELGSAQVQERISRLNHGSACWTSDTIYWRLDDPVSIHLPLQARAGSAACDPIGAGARRATPAPAFSRLPHFHCEAAHMPTRTMCSFWSRIPVLWARTRHNMSLVYVQATTKCSQASYAKAVALARRRAGLMKT